MLRTALPLATVTTLSALLAAPVVAAAETPEDRVWERLARYRGSYLRAWASALDGPPGSAMEVLEAFGEVAAKVTGPGGFWRTTVPDQWLGCANPGALLDDHRLACERLREAEPTLRRWDRLRRRVGRLTHWRAGPFLARRHAELTAYLDAVVPDEPSASAMARTGFFRRTLSDILAP